MITGAMETINDINENKDGGSWREQNGVSEAGSNTDREGRLDRQGGSDGNQTIGVGGEVCPQSSSFDRRGSISGGTIQLLIEEVDEQIEELNVRRQKAINRISEYELKIQRLLARKQRLSDLSH
jgi:hypothetical protein